MVRCSARAIQKTLKYKRNNPRRKRGVCVFESVTCGILLVWFDLVLTMISSSLQPFNTVIPGRWQFVTYMFGVGSCFGFIDFFLLAWKILLRSALQMILRSITISYGIVELRSSRCAMSRLNHLRSMCYCLHRFPDRGVSLSFCLLVAGALACENLMDRRHYVSRVWRLLLVVCAFVVQGFLMLSRAWTYSIWQRPNIRV